VTVGAYNTVVTNTMSFFTARANMLRNGNRMKGLLKDLPKFGMMGLKTDKRLGGINLLDPAVRSAVQYAADKGLAVVIMEPLRGGQLTGKVPPSVADLWQSAATRRTPADWALQWIWNHPQVSVVLSGMSTMQHVLENLDYADRSGAALLSEEELILVGKIRQEYRRIVPVPCTDCKYCLPCPNSVEIAEIFEHYNNANIYDNPRAPRFHYSNLSKDQQADNCVECFECEEKCPQGIPIVEYLKKAHALLGEKK
jgi:hypothetical protein